MSFILNVSDFTCFNGFYRLPECRQTVFQLYHKTCQGCRADLSRREDYVSAHIIARRHAGEFEKLFPGLDVDNLLNLHLLCHPCNVRQSAYHFESPFFLNQVFKESARAIQLRYAKISERINGIARATYVAKAVRDFPDNAWFFQQLVDSTAKVKNLLKNSKQQLIEVDIQDAHVVLNLATAALFDFEGRKLGAAEQFYPWIVFLPEHFEDGEQEFNAKPLFDSLPSDTQAKVRAKLAEGRTFGVVRRAELRELVRLAQLGGEAQAAQLYGQQPAYIATAQSRATGRLRALIDGSREVWHPLITEFLTSFVERDPEQVLNSAVAHDENWLYWSEEQLEVLTSQLFQIWPDALSSKELMARLFDTFYCSGVHFHYDTKELSIGGDASFLVDAVPRHPPHLHRNRKTGLWVCKPALLHAKNFTLSTLSCNRYRTLSAAIAVLTQCYATPDSLGRIVSDFEAAYVMQKYASVGVRARTPKTKRPRRAEDRYLDLSAFEVHMARLDEILPSSAGDAAERPLVRRMPVPFIKSLGRMLSEFSRSACS